MVRRRARSGKTLGLTISVVARKARERLATKERLTPIAGPVLRVKSRGAWSIARVGLTPPLA